MFTNNQNLPLSLAVFLAHDEYPEPREKVISVTTLLKPIKEIVLSMKQSGEVSTIDIANRTASTYGTALHNGIERAWTHENLPDTLKKLGYAPGLIKAIKVNPTDEELHEDMIPVYTELRTEKKFQGWTVSGEFDFVAEGKVRDFKSTGVYTWIHGTNDKKYPMQGSMYRWLNPEKITQDVMAIDFIFTDWSGLAAHTQKDYPPFRMMSRDYVLEDVEVIEQWISHKLKQIDEYLLADDQSLIPDCTNEDLWVGDSSYKYYKNPNSLKRATRVYDNPTDAYNHHRRDGGVGIVMEVKDPIKACRYCSALHSCEQAQRYLNSGELKL